jgi:hypothetical protein
MEHICPKVEKCPIFINNVLTIENAAVAYKTLYCQAGEARYKTCKRYIVSNVLGSCPPSVMPNSCKSIEEIKAKIHA